MKNYLLLLLLSGMLLSQSLQAINMNKVHDAIEASDLVAVKKLLQRSGGLQPVEQKDLLEAAQDMVDVRKAKVSLFKSNWDLFKLFGGGLLGATGLLFTVVGVVECVKHENYKLGLPMSLAGGVASSFGFYKAFRGLLCATAHERLAQAKKILEELRRTESLKEQK